MKNVVLRVTGYLVYSANTYICCTEDHTYIQGIERAQKMTVNDAEAFIANMKKLGYLQTFEIEFTV